MLFSGSWYIADEKKKSTIIWDSLSRFSTSALGSVRKRWVLRMYQESFPLQLQLQQQMPYPCFRITRAIQIIKLPFFEDSSAFCTPNPNGEGHTFIIFTEVLYILSHQSEVLISLFLQSFSTCFQICILIRCFLFFLSSRDYTEMTKNNQLIWSNDQMDSSFTKGAGLGKKMPSCHC